MKLSKQATIEKVKKMDFIESERYYGDFVDVNDVYELIDEIYQDDRHTAKQVINAKCPNCKIEIDYVGNYCKNCGQRLNYDGNSGINEKIYREQA